MGIVIRDVTLRDGLQDERPISTAEKVTLWSALRDAGVREFELTSFVRADRVPALADAERVVAETTGDGQTRWGLVLNERGAQRALATGLTALQFVLSVSDEHNLNNAGRTAQASVGELLAIVGLAASVNARVEVTLATSFGCPHTGAVSPDRVRRLVDEVIGCGVAGIGLADTIGTAVPTEVRELVTAVRTAHPAMPLGVHLHDTRGLALANALAALEAGALRLDASLGGLGGCPFAPGASGNLALEDLVHALEQMGIPTGIDVDRLIEAARFACSAVGRPVSSHVGVAGPRFSQLHP